MKFAGALVAGALLLSGCLHHNVVRNADRLYSRAEVERRAGRENAAAMVYADIVRKTGQALRAHPNNDWADEALLLLGQSRLRLGEYGESQAALVALGRRTETPGLRIEADIYLGVLKEEVGEPEEALGLVNAALKAAEIEGRGAIGDEARAEAYLLRGRILLERGQPDRAWLDLDRAVDADRDAAVEVAMERLQWAIASNDPDRTRFAVDALLADPRAGVRVDSVGLAVWAAADQWGARAGADLLAGTDSATWPRAARDRIVLQRARLLDAAGDTAAASDQALRVAGGLGVSAAEGRLLLSEWRAQRARDLPEIYALRALLLPAAGTASVSRRLRAIDRLELFASVGLDDSLGWFAAAEVARDYFGAEYLARGLFLAYADGSPGEPWVPKSLLAALEVSKEEADRAWLRGRLEGHRESPYVLAAHGGTSAGFEELEEELEVRLKELTNE